MSYVPVIVPPPAPPSRQTRELAELLGLVIEEYERAHPTVTGDEVRQALVLARRASPRPEGTEVRGLWFLLWLGFAVFTGLVVVFMARQG